jgi:hypothetical protein
MSYSAFIINNNLLSGILSRNFILMDDLLPSSYYYSSSKRLIETLGILNTFRFPITFLFLMLEFILGNLFF